MSAEAVAAAVSTIRAGRVDFYGGNATSNQVLPYALENAAQVGPVIDITGLRAAYLKIKERPFAADACISPPWRAAAFCWHTDRSEVAVMTYAAREHPSHLGQFAGGLNWDSMQNVDWGMARWDVIGFGWGVKFDGAGGPWSSWRLVIGGDGELMAVGAVYLGNETHGGYWTGCTRLVMEASPVR